MFAGTDRHEVHPPVFASAKLPITGADGESRRTSTRPDTPPEAPEATVATNRFAGTPEPKSSPENFNQSPLPRPVTADEPTDAPFESDAASASITRYAEPPEPAVGVAVAVAVAVGVGVAVGVSVAVAVAVEQAMK